MWTKRSMGNLAQTQKKNLEIQPDHISQLLLDNYWELMYEFYEMQTTFLSKRYKIHKCIQSANIIISLIKNVHLSIVRQREKKLDFIISLDNFWDNFKKIEKPTNKIVSIVSITGIPKETVRRKIKKLIKNQFIKSDTENSRQYFWNLTLKRKDNFLEVMDSDIKAMSRFINKITKNLNLNLTQKNIQDEIKDQFSFYFYHFLDCQLKWLRMWQIKIKDVDLIFIAMQALIPTLRYGDKKINLNNLGIDNINTIVGQTNNQYKNSNKSISAASVSDVTGIPRATCARKLEKLSKLGFLIKDNETRRYYVNQFTESRTKNIITKDNIRFTINCFSEYLSIIANALIRNKN